MSIFVFVGLEVRDKLSYFLAQNVFLFMPLTVFTPKSTQSKLLRSFQLLRLSQPFMEKHLKIQDTCGIHNLHAMPGVIGGIVGAITAAAATESVYGREGWVETCSQKSEQL